MKHEQALAELSQSASEVADPVDRFRRADALIDQLQATISELHAVRASATAELHASGMTYKEVGETLSISTARVGQLVNSTAGLPHLFRAWSELERKLGLLGSYSSVPSDRRSPARLIEALDEAGVLSPDQVLNLRALLTARNEAVHSRRVFSDSEIDLLLDDVIALSAQLELAVGEAEGSYRAEATTERERAESLLRRVATQYPAIDWREGRCDECGLPIPVEDLDALWVCSQECRTRWMAMLYHFINPGSEEEAISRTPRVVPYWI